MTPLQFLDRRFKCGDVRKLFCQFDGHCKFKSVRNRSGNRHASNLTYYYAFCLWDSTCNQQSFAPVVVEDYHKPRVKIVATK